MKVSLKFGFLKNCIGFKEGIYWEVFVLKTPNDNINKIKIIKITFKVKNNSITFWFALGIKYSEFDTDENK